MNLNVLAKLCNLSDAEVSELGLWSLDVQKCHYFHIYQADMISRLSGFQDIASYWIPRSLASVKEFMLKNPGSEELFSAFLGFVDDPVVEEAALRMRQSDERTPISVLRTLSILRDVFWQDLYYYKRHYPQLRLFRSDLFRLHEDMVDRWICYCESFNELETTSISRDLSSSAVLHSNEMGRIREALDHTNTLLSAVTKTLLAKSESEEPPSKANESKKRSIRPLNG